MLSVAMFSMSLPGGKPPDLPVGCNQRGQVVRGQIVSGRVDVVPFCSSCFGQKEFSIEKRSKVAFFAASRDTKKGPDQYSGCVRRERQSKARKQFIVGVGAASFVRMKKVRTRRYPMEL